jgi:hypothetical protein
VKVFSIACDSASITSAVSQWRPSSFIFNLRNRKVGCVGDDSHVVFEKFPGEKRKRETVCCRDATAGSYVTKGRGEVFEHFHASVVKGRILCEQNMLVLSSTAASPYYNYCIDGSTSPEKHRHL